VIDRFWFKSVYFLEPGGVLFEIATDGPGFTVDESPAELGTALRLPARLENMRQRLEVSLPPLRPPHTEAVGG
jgi:glyoxalase family protein